MPTREDQGVAGCLLEILVLAHQAAHPGVLQLLLSPHQADLRPAAGEVRVACGGNRVDVEERAVEVEDDGLDIFHGWVWVVRKWRKTGEGVNAACRCRRRNPSGRGRTPR